ncbi:MAG: esterase [Myxococcota bacterium]
MRTAQMGPLKVRIVGGTDGEGGGDGPMVVLMHGFGAPGTDLVGLTQVLRAPPGTRFIFPEAPISLSGPAAFPMGDSRAWWMIDVEAIQRLVAVGEFRDLRNHEPEGIVEARERVVEMLDALDSSLKPPKTILGGFSQGAMLATEVTLQTERSLHGLMLFSGTLLAEHLWRPRMSTRAELPVFQSHGRADPVLPFTLAEALNTTMQQEGMKASFVAFDGGHEIGGPALIGANEFLAQHL